MNMQTWLVGLVYINPRFWLSRFAFTGSVLQWREDQIELTSIFLTITIKNVGEDNFSDQIRETGEGGRLPKNLLALLIFCQRNGYQHLPLAYFRLRISRHNFDLNSELYE